MQPYDHKQIEPKWQKVWAKNKAGVAKDPKKSKAGNAKGNKKFYSLIEFPYPSGDGLHVGHIRSNTAMDIISHKRRREGYDVLYPIGWDAFGLPTENYAIKTGIQPAVVTKKNTDTFRRQLKSLGFFFDWSREINTTDPKYYRWTQWIFLQFLKEGLAYKKKMTINWCPKDLIGLANEEVVDGKCERCGTPVEKREKEQWMLAITKYAEKLLAGLDATDYVMPKLIDMANPHQPGKPVIQRNVTHAIVYDPRSKKYLIIRNKKFAWDTVIIGGIEEGETAEETAQREVREETGYTDIEFKRLLGGKTEAHYYTKHKGENRVAFAQGVYFELKSDARVPIADGEDAQNEILWIDEKDFVPGKMVNSEMAIWLERIKNPEAGWPKPVLDWSESIKESQRNWIGKSEGAEFDFNISKKYQYVLLHGYKGSPADLIYLWLKKELEKMGHSVLVPALPHPGKPSEDEQVAAAMAALNSIGYGEDTILYGHSLGSVVAMKVAEKLQKKIAGLVLAGGFADLEFKDHPRPFAKTFNWNFDAKKIKTNVGFVTLLHDINDVAISEGQADRLGALLTTPVQKVAAEATHFDGDTEPTILKALTPSLKVFTTRPDTLFGVTYVVVAPEHPWLRALLPQIQNKKEVEDYIFKAKNQTDIIRTDAKREKTGVELRGISAINPANDEKVPVWVADYVLGDYGTGAVMAVPAHDERDWDFAKKYGLPIREMVIPVEGEPHKGSEFRKTVSSIVYRKSDGKFLALKWKKFGWLSVPIGGIENDESPEVTAEREVFEETGYKTKAVGLLGGTIESHFFAENKNVWRARLDQPVLLELTEEKPVVVSAEEKDKHEAVWMAGQELLNQITHKYNGIGLERYLKNNYAFTKSGKIINSGKYDGRKNDAVKKEIAAAFGTPKTTYKLRDWVFSRQRYWGEPIPVVHCEECGIVPVPEKDLPVKLPEVKNYKPTETGESPLAAISKWVYVKCPKCGSKKQKDNYFIFDFDGVLGDTWKAAIKAHMNMGNSSTEEEAAKGMHKFFDNRPNHVRDVIRTPEKIRQDLDFIKTFGKHVNEIKPALFNDFIKEVKKHKNAKCAVVSSGSQAYVLPMLKKAGIKFTHILAFEDHSSKEEKIEWICKDWNVGVRDVYYFTDTKADVYELENLLDRSKIIGCAWGYHGFDVLREVLPEKQILKNFKDFGTFFENAGLARRETDTMPNWAGSSWYYLRYTDPKNAKAFAAADKLKYWTPVDWYNGGMEHTTLHLLYSRFWHKFLFDQGLVPTSEPYTKRTSHGLILAKGGEKMSKSKGNVVNPDGIVEAVGADSLRLYEMFMGPFDQAIAWDENGIVGCRRFIERVWKLAEKVRDAKIVSKNNLTSDNESDTLIHKTIKKVSEDIEAMRFNTAVSALMIAVNELEKISEVAGGISADNYASLLLLLAPFAPHVTEELWQKLGGLKGKSTSSAVSIHQAPWPQFDPLKITSATLKIAIQINGKTRSSFEISAEEANLMDEQKALEKASTLDEIKKWIYGKEIKKVIYVKGRLINIVIA